MNIDKIFQTVKSPEVQLSKMYTLHLASLKLLILIHRRSEKGKLSLDPCGLTHCNPLAIVTQGPEVVPPVQGQIQKNTVKYIWPTNHHSWRRPPYRLYRVLPLPLPFALVQQESRHTTSMSSPRHYTPLCVYLVHSQ